MKKRILMISERIPFPSDNGGKMRTANMMIHLSYQYDIDFVAYSQYPVSEFQMTKLRSLCSDVYVFPDGLPTLTKHIKAFLKGDSGIVCGIWSEIMRDKIYELAA